MTRARETFGIWLALAPALAVVGLLVGVNLAFPHLVWAVALSLLLAQSGLLARLAAALGLIDAPAQFPVLVRDRYGLGIILHYVIKEMPFLVLIVLAVLRTQGATYDLVAENLGALPLLGPGLAVAALFAFLVSWSQYVLTLLIGGGRVIILPILLFAVVSGGNPTLIAGLALLFAAPPVIAIVLAARALSAGAAEVGQQY